MLWHPKTLQNLAMYNVFFIFGRFSIAGKLPKWPKIPFQYPLALRHPKILEKCRKHHRILVSVRNRFWAPPAKADIATAILTNVIEHLVLLLPPNKHAFTAKAVWADFFVKLWRSDICCWRNSQKQIVLRTKWVQEFQLMSGQFGLPISYQIPSSVFSKTRLWNSECSWAATST